MRKRNLPGSAEPSDNESESHQKKQLRSDTPKKLTVAEQRQKAREWAEQNLTPAKVGTASVPKSATKSVTKSKSTSAKGLSVEEQRKRAEEWAIESGLLRSAGKKRIATEDEETVEELVEAPSTRKRNVRRKTLELNANQQNEEDSIGPQGTDTSRDEPVATPQTRRGRPPRAETVSISASATEVEDDTTIGSRRSSRRSTLEGTLNKTPARSLRSSDNDSVSSTQRRKTIEISQIPKPTEARDELRRSTRKASAQREIVELSGPKTESPRVDINPIVPTLINQDTKPKEDNSKITASDKKSDETVEEITPEQTRLVLILLLVAQTLALLLLVLFWSNNYTGGIITVLLTLFLAAGRRLVLHLFRFNATTDE